MVVVVLDITQVEPLPKEQEEMAVAATAVIANHPVLQLHHKTEPPILAVAVVVL